MVRRGPHHSRIGKRDSRQMDTEVRRLWGHVSTAPIDVFDQSSAPARAPISPPEANSRSTDAMLTAPAAPAPSVGYEAHTGGRLWVRRSARAWRLGAPSRVPAHAACDIG